MKKNLSLLMIMFMISASTFAQNRETRNVPTFKKIAFRVPGKLYIKQGNTQKVEIEASREVLKQIETEVEGSRLNIGREEKWNSWKWMKDETITVYVTVKDLEGLSVSGSGDAIGETPFITGDIDLNVSGSGSLKIEVQASGEVEADVSGSGELNVKGKGNAFDSDVSGSGRVVMNMNIRNDVSFEISGSGKIQAQGNADVVKTSISGSGKVLGADLQVNRCDVRISGSGDVEISVKDQLDANISGSGSVSYRGNPGKINSHSSGSGRVSKM